jgi:hypothetical protein
VALGLHECTYKLCDSAKYILFTALNLVTRSSVGTIDIIISISSRGKVSIIAQVFDLLVLELV